tara:strand:- start:503 stop:922 length:420 start_codon:yes stop_codon:yes gene_type:complete
MKNFLLKFLGIDTMHSELLQSIERVEEKVANQLDNVEENIKRDVLSETEYEIEQLVSGEVEDKLYNYNFDDMEADIEDARARLSDIEDEDLVARIEPFETRLERLSNNLVSLSDRIDTLTLIERIEKLEALSSWLGETK